MRFMGYNVLAILAAAILIYVIEFVIFGLLIPGEQYAAMVGLGMDQMRYPLATVGCERRVELDHVDQRLGVLALSDREVEDRCRRAPAAGPVQPVEVGGRGGEEDAGVAGRMKDEVEG